MAEDKKRTRRVVTSGTATTPNEKRGRKMTMISLSPEEIDRADALAERWETTRSGAIARAVTEALEGESAERERHQKSVARKPKWP